MEDVKKVPNTLALLLEGRLALHDLAVSQGNFEAARAVLESAIRDAYNCGVQDAGGAA